MPGLSALLCCCSPCCLVAVPQALPQLEWLSNETIKASQTENEEAPVVEGNVVYSLNMGGILPHGVLGNVLRC